jgi:Poly (ADP-ribose) glycohydrolase (PARG), Macro domain fold
MSLVANPICRRVFDTQKLVAEFPPRIASPNKRIVYGIACPPGSAPSGQIVFSRWAKTSLPATLEPDISQTQFEAREDFFGYEPPQEGTRVVEWYVNFAHSDLFCAYGGSLFAQDEMQVAEHPALGSLREALLRSDIRPLTVENGQPTPALVMGVERRCRVATDGNAALGRPNGLYGNNFSRASAEAVERATQVITPPTITNLLAMEAPAGGNGRYTRQQIEYILSTAFTGFNAARLESCRDRAELAEVVVHTGFWGCGAYGGNRVLMALLQLLAARLARLGRLVFHTGDAAGSGAFLQASRTLQQDSESTTQPRKVSDLIVQTESMGLQWGVSDGN